MSMLKVISYPVIQYRKYAPAVEKTIIDHSLVAGALTLIPLSAVTEIALIFCQIRMYKKIHEITKTKFFSDEIFKHIAKFILSQVTGILVGFVTVYAIGFFVKFVPGLNFVAGIIQAPAAAIANYICGMTYFKILGELIEKAKGAEMNVSEIQKFLRTNKNLSDVNIKQLKKQAETALKDANYAAHVAEAKKIADKISNQK